MTKNQPWPVVTSHHNGILLTFLIYHHEEWVEADSLFKPAEGVDMVKCGEEWLRKEREEEEGCGFLRILLRTDFS